jgi:hypothetical protein
VTQAGLERGINLEGLAAMLDRHNLAHTALTAVYIATALILTIEGTYAHAICALAAAVIYAFLSRRPRNHDAS